MGTITIKNNKTHKHILSKINPNEDTAQNEKISNNNHQVRELFYNIGTAALIVDVEKSVWFEEDMVVLTAICRFEVG